jgi:hypothetical protein
VGRDGVEEPAVISDDHRAAGALSRLRLRTGTGSQIALHYLVGVHGRPTRKVPSLRTHVVVSRERVGSTSPKETTPVYPDYRRGEIVPVDVGDVLNGLPSDGLGGKAGSAPHARRSASDRQRPENSTVKRACSSIWCAPCKSGWLSTKTVRSSSLTGIRRAVSTPTATESAGLVAVD